MELHELDDQLLRAGAPAVRLALLAADVREPRDVFGDPGGLRHRALLFAGAYVALTIGRTSFALVGFGTDTRCAACSRARSCGGAGPASVDRRRRRRGRRTLRALGLAVGRRIHRPLAPRLPGAAPRPHRPRDYTIAGEHMAERCLLFITLSLGESILIVGSPTWRAARHLRRSARRWSSRSSGTIALWRIYFDRIADAGRHLMSTAPIPGASRSAPTPGPTSRWSRASSCAPSPTICDRAPPRRRRHRGHADHPRRACAVPDRQLLVPVGPLGLGAALNDIIGLVALAAVIPLAALEPPAAADRGDGDPRRPGDLRRSHERSGNAYACSAMSAVTPARIAPAPASCRGPRRSPRANQPTAAAIRANWDAITAGTATPIRSEAAM